MKPASLLSLALIMLFALPHSSMADDPIQISVSGLYSHVIIGEEQTLTIRFKNGSDEKQVIPDLHQAFASGRARLSMLDATGNVMPQSMHWDLAIHDPTAVTTLGPGDEIVMERSTTQTGVRLTKAGEYRIRFSIPIDGKVYNHDWPFTVHDPHDLKAGPRTRVIPESKRDSQEFGSVQGFKIGDQYWLYFRRMDAHGVVAVRRISQISALVAVFAVADGKNVRVTFTPHGTKHTSTRLLEYADGTDVDANE